MLDLRAIDRMIQSPDFVTLWEDAAQKERGELIGYIRDVNIEAVREWFEEEQVVTLEDLSKRELVKLASYHHVKNYSRMSKDQLRRALRKRGVDDETIQE